MLKTMAPTHGSSTMAAGAHHRMLAIGIAATARQSSTAPSGGTIDPPARLNNQAQFIAAKKSPTAPTTLIPIQRMVPGGAMYDTASATATVVQKSQLGSWSGTCFYVGLPNSNSTGPHNSVQALERRAV